MFGRSRTMLTRIFSSDWLRDNSQTGSRPFLDSIYATIGSLCLIVFFKKNKTQAHTCACAHTHILSLLSLSPSLSLTHTQLKYTKHTFFNSLAAHVLSTSLQNIKLVSDENIIAKITTRQICLNNIFMTLYITIFVFHWWNLGSTRAASHDSLLCGTNSPKNASSIKIILTYSSQE